MIIRERAMKNLMGFSLSRRVLLHIARRQNQALCLPEQTENELIRNWKTNSTQRLKNNTKMLVAMNKSGRIQKKIMS